MRTKLHIVLYLYAVLLCVSDIYAQEPVTTATIGLARTDSAIVVNADYIIYDLIFTCSSNVMDNTPSLMKQTVDDFENRITNESEFAIGKLVTSKLISYCREGITGVRANIPIASPEPQQMSSISTCVQIIHPMTNDTGATVRKIRGVIDEMNVPSQLDVKVEESLSPRLTDPEQYRTDIITNIMNNVMQIKEAISNYNAEITITGLERTINVQPCDSQTVYLSIPYEISVTVKILSSREE